ncbi:MAG: NAD(P)/FAD-dependent oxidoreductase [Clostridia bacterium]
MNKVCVIGGGAAGLIAAIVSARNGNEVYLYEKNQILGKKLLITGKGRCNVTNKCELNTFLDNIVTNKKFLYSAFSSFTSNDVIDFFESLGVSLKVERGNRVFPTSDKSSDIVSSLVCELKNVGVKVINQAVISLESHDGKICGIVTNEKKESFDKVIVATGGISYPKTGSTGDGYKFAKSQNHTVTKLLPSLVPLVVYDDFCESLMGLSLRNVKITLYQNETAIFEDFGEMLFTHFGISGPIILSASAHINFEHNNKFYLDIDLKPALNEQKLDARILRDFEENKNKEILHVLPKLLPTSLVKIMLARCSISQITKVNNITKEQRLLLIKNIKAFRLSIKCARPIDEAIITRGGVDVSKINPRTMESTLVSGLFFAGEVLDLDAYTGGFNLQIAFSTGYLAANNL